MAKRIRATLTALLAPVVAFGASAAAAGEYTVEPGDTLSEIAAAHGISWPQLHALNADTITDPHLIHPGQVLEVPDNRATGPKPTRPTPTAAPGDTVRPATGHVTSRYGMRTHPVTGVYKLHTGTDYALGDGRAYAARAGTVVAAEWAGAYGRMVTLDHDDGVVTRYAHLASFSVKPRDRVKAGQVVGRIGSTGHATGPHLHFEVLISGEFTNPESWLTRHGAPTPTAGSN